MEQKFAPFKRQMLRSLTESYNTGVEEYFRLLSSITPFSKKEKIKEVEAKTKEIAAFNQKLDAMIGNKSKELKAWTEVS